MKRRVSFNEANAEIMNASTELEPDEIQPWVPPVPVSKDSSHQNLYSQPQNLDSLLNQIEFKNMKVFDRMVLDINKRSLVKKISEHRFANESLPKRSSQAKVFNRLVNDVKRRSETKKTIEVCKQIREQNQSPPKRPGSAQAIQRVIQRLDNDSKMRQASLKQRQLIKQREEQEEYERSKSAPKLSKEKAQSLVQRLTQDAQKRLEIINYKRELKKKQQEEETKQKLQKAHPRRPLDPEVQARLTKQSCSPQRTPSPTRKSTQSTKRLEFTPQPKQKSKFSHVKPRYGLALFKNKNSQSFRTCFDVSELSPLNKKPFGKENNSFVKSNKSVVYVSEDIFTGLETSNLSSSPKFGQKAQVRVKPNRRS